MLTNIFITVLNMSISGALIAALLILWRTLSHRYIPSKFYYILWLVLMLRLIIPFSPKSIFSPLNLFKNSGDYSYGNRYIVTMEYLEYNDIASVSAVQSETFIAVIAAIWAVVATALIVMWIVVYLSAQKQLRYAVLYKNDTVCQVKRNFEISSRVNVYISPNVLSPIVIGFFKPKVVIPKKEQLPQEEIRYALAHEMVHAKRYDQLIKAVYFFILALHWYNPLVWISFYLFNQDIETSCDQKVLSVYGMEHRERYANVLIDYAARKNLFQMGYLSFAKNKTAERISKILEYKKLTAVKTFIFTVITLAIGFSVSTNPVFAEGYQYVPDTVYIDSNSRQIVEEYVNSFIADIEQGDYKAIAQKSTADSDVFQPYYKIFEHQKIKLQADKIFYTSDKAADVYLAVIENDGTVFPKQSKNLVVQLGTSRIMGGLFVENLHTLEKYNSINKIDHNDEAVMLVDKIIKFGITDGSNTPENAAKITAFCMDIAFDRAKDDTMVLIPQKAVEDIAKEFFMTEDFANMHNTDYFDKANGVYVYDMSIGTHYECQIVDLHKTEREAIVTVEFYKDPLQTQVEKIVQYTLKKV